MEVAASAVAIIQGAELAIRYTKRINDIVNGYKTAVGGLHELCLRVEGVLLKTEVQLNVILDLSSASTQRLLQFQEDCRDTLGTRLYQFLGQLEHYGDALQPNGAKKRIKLKYGLLKKSLQEALCDLEAWHSIFDPSWYLITRLVNNQVDVSLEKNTKQSSTQLAVTTVQEVRAVLRDVAKEVPPLNSSLLPANSLSEGTLAAEGSSLRFALNLQTGQNVVLDTTAYPDNAESYTVIRSVREIAHLLSITDPFSLGFLKCLGVVRLNERQFRYVFKVPRESPPKVLRSLLNEESPSLDSKLQIAKLLARAVTSLHTANFVHKNIRPETIVVFKDGFGEMSEPFLVGFEQTRPYTAHSGLIADMTWYRNLYRHPSRQGLQPQEYYNMQHDIYSLGVCLLEIGIWASFVDWSSGEPEGSLFLDLRSELAMRNKKQAALQIKAKLINKAQTELPRQMGRSYTEVVVSCLTCLDPDSASMFEHEDGLYDQDGIVIGVAFIEKILVRLGNLRI